VKLAPKKRTQTINRIQAIHKYTHTHTHTLTSTGVTSTTADLCLGG